MNQKTESLSSPTIVCVGSLQMGNSHGKACPWGEKNAQREEKGVAMLPRGFTPQQTKRCGKMLGCTHANISQWYFLE